MNTTATSSVSRWWRVAFAITMWAVLAGCWWWYQRHTGRGSIATAQSMIDRARGAWWALFAYLAVSLVRPLVFFPATLLTVAAGILFGPVVGIAVAAVAANLSAALGYTIGHRLRGTGNGVAGSGTLAGWAERLRANTFEAVLLTRLLFLPYDAVNYACGLLRVRATPFIAATAIGTLPGTVAFVLVGSSITRIDDGLAGVSRTTLLISVALIAASITLSRLVRRRSPASPAVG